MVVDKLRRPSSANSIPLRHEYRPCQSKAMSPAMPHAPPASVAAPGGDPAASGSAPRAFVGISPRKSPTAHTLRRSRWPGASLGGETMKPQEKARAATAMQRIAAGDPDIPTRNTV